VKKPEGYRVDLRLNLGSWVEYTSKKRPVTLEMAQSLAEHLRRGGSGGRIMKVPEETVVESWEGEKA